MLSLMTMAASPERSLSEPFGSSLVRLSAYRSLILVKEVADKLERERTFAPAVLRLLLVTQSVGALA